MVDRFRLNVTNTIPLLWRLGNVWLRRKLGGTPNYLPIIDADITDRCNLNCRFCGCSELVASSRGKEELSTREWKDVIDTAARLGTFLFNICGGEPLIRDDVYEIIAHATGRGLAVHLVSNGFFLDEIAAKRLSDASLGSAQISLEAAQASGHDALRGRGSFDRAVRAIHALQAEAPGVEIGVNCVITPENLATLGEVIRFVDGLGVHKLRFTPVYLNLQHRLVKSSEIASLVFSEEELPKLEVELDRLMAELTRSRLRSSSLAYHQNIIALLRNQAPRTCYAGYAFASINPYGVVGPCYDWEGGRSVRDTPLDVIWAGEELGRLREEVNHCTTRCVDPMVFEINRRFRPPGSFDELRRDLSEIAFYLRG